MEVLDHQQLFPLGAALRMVRGRKARRAGTTGAGETGAGETGAGAKHARSRPAMHLPPETEEALRIVVHRLTHVRDQSPPPPRVVGLTSCSRGEGVSTILRTWQFPPPPATRGGSYSSTPTLPTLPGIGSLGCRRARGGGMSCAEIAPSWRWCAGWGRGCRPFSPPATGPRT